MFVVNTENRKGYTFL